MTESSRAVSAGDTGSPSEKNTIVLRPGYSASDRTTVISDCDVPYPLVDRSKSSNDRSMFSSV